MSTHTHGGLEATGDGSASLPTDDLHHLLSNHRQRTILAVLHADGPADMRTLAERVAASETGKAVGDLDAAERKRAHVSCYQVHVPKLLDHGAVEQRGDTYHLGETADALLPHCEGVDRGWVSKAVGFVPARY